MASSASVGLRRGPFMAGDYYETLRTCQYEELRRGNGARAEVQGAECKVQSAGCRVQGAPGLRRSVRQLGASEALRALWVVCRTSAPPRERSSTPRGTRGRSPA